MLLRDRKERDRCMDNNKSPLQQLDYGLLFIMFLLAIISAVSIHSAPLPPKLENINFASRQLVWYGISLVAIAGVMIIDFDRFRLISWYLYGFGMLLLLGLEFGAPGTQTIKGATSWYQLPGLGNFQPSELMKIFLIIVISSIIFKHNEIYIHKTIQDDFWLLGKILLTSLPPLLLVMKQPDLGTAMVLSAIVAALILVSGIRWRIIGGIVLTFILAAISVVVVYFTFTDWFESKIIDNYGHALERFYGWLAPYEYPTEGYQLTKALLAIGSGQLEGKGFRQTEVYLPEAHTDFIFGVIAEQFGFIGASFVISLFFMLVYRMIQIALDSHDPFGSYLVTGVIGMITFQVFQNIGMTIQLMPITGIPLPFISYGGSSLVTYMIALGLALNVRSRTRTYMFD